MGETKNAIKHFFFLKSCFVNIYVGVKRRYAKGISDFCYQKKRNKWFKELYKLTKADYSLKLYVWIIQCIYKLEMNYKIQSKKKKEKN